MLLLVEASFFLLLFGEEGGEKAPVFPDSEDLADRGLPPPAGGGEGEENEGSSLLSFSS